MNKCPRCGSLDTTTEDIDGRAWACCLECGEKLTEIGPEGATLDDFDA